MKTLSHEDSANLLAHLEYLIGASEVLRNKLSPEREDYFTGAIDALDTMRSFIEAITEKTPETLQ